MRSIKEKLEAQRASLVKTLHEIMTQKDVVSRQMHRGSEQYHRTGARMPRGIRLELRTQLKELKSRETRVQSDLALIRLAGLVQAMARPPVERV